MRLSPPPLDTPLVKQATQSSLFPHQVPQFCGNTMIKNAQWSASFYPSKFGKSFSPWSDYHLFYHFQKWNRFEWIWAARKGLENTWTSCAKVNFTIKTSNDFLPPEEKILIKIKRSQCRNTNSGWGRERRRRNRGDARRRFTEKPSLRRETRKERISTDVWRRLSRSW